MRQVPEQHLRCSFLDLHSRLSGRGVSLILGGGFGLFLKQLDLLKKENMRTFLPIEAWPRPRTTNDLDLFIPIELLVHLSDMQTVRTVLDELKFQAIDESRFWQFELPDTNVKVDLLTGPIPVQARSLLDIEGGKSGRRVRPKGYLELHARRTPEAVGLAENQEEITVEGKLSDGSDYSGIVRIPSPFTYLMMKLTASGDQLANERRAFGRHHALDVYRIVAMLTEPRYEQTRQQFSIYAHEQSVQTAVGIAQQFFDSPDSAGNIRMREHAFYGDNMDLSAFIDGLGGLVQPEG